MNRSELEALVRRIDRLARDARDGRRERAGVLEEIVATATAALEADPRQRIKDRIDLLARRRAFVARIINAGGLEARVALARVQAEMTYLHDRYLGLIRRATKNSKSEHRPSALRKAARVANNLRLRASRKEEV